MDLTINIENYKLNIRAAGIIEHNGKKQRDALIVAKKFSQLRRNANIVGNG